MALSSSVAAYTLIGMAEKFQDFFYGDAQDVTFKYMDADGNILTKTVPNIAKVTAELRDNGVSDSDIEQALEDYYDKSGVDELISSLRSELNTNIGTAKTEAIASANSYTDNNAMKALNFVDITYTDSSYSVSENEHVRVDSSDGVVVLIAPTPVANAYFEFNTGDSASTNKIRLEVNDNETITYGDTTDTSFEVSTNSKTFCVRFDGVNNTWRIN